MRRPVESALHAEINVTPLVSRLPYRTVRRLLAELNAAHFERAGILAKRRQR